MHLKKLEANVKLFHAQVSFITLQQTEQQKITRKIIAYSKRVCRLLPASRQLKSSGAQLTARSSASTRSFDVYAHLLPGKEAV